MRRLAIILVVIVVVGAAAFALYYFIWYQLPSTPPSPTTGPTSGAATSANPASVGQVGGGTAGQKFGVVAQNPTTDYFVDGQNNVFLIQPDGQIAEVMGGAVSILSSSQINNLIDAAFSYDGKKILASFGDTSTPQLSIFDTTTKSWRPLPSGLRTIAWSPNDYRLAYLTTKGGVTTLAVLDASSTKAEPTTLLSLHAEDLRLYWPSPNQIILSDRGSALFAGSAWGFDLKKKTLVPLIGDELGLESTWNGLLNEGLVFGTNISQRGGNLSLMDAAGNTLNNLTFLTLPSKCFFNQEGGSSPQATTTGTAASTTMRAATKNFLYCAVPRDKQKLNTATLPDDYDMKVLFTADDIYKINLSDGSINILFSNPMVDVDATNLKMFNGTLFFVNRLDQKIYVITSAAG